VAACAIVCACSDADRSDPAPTPSAHAEDAVPQQQEAVSSLQSWAQQATAGVAPSPQPPVQSLAQPASDALAPPVIHTVE